MDEGNPNTRPRLIDVENFPYRTMLLSIDIRAGLPTKNAFFGYCKFLQNYICIPCKNHENLWSALFALHSNWSQYFLIQTRPSRMGVGVGKDTVRRVHFRVFSTSHFAPTLLSSDWQVLIFRHRHFWSHFLFTNRESQLTFRTELEKVLIFVTFFRH